MHGLAAPEYGFWLAALAAVGLGAAIIVALAALAERPARSAVWQRTMWQVAVVGLLAWLAVEMSGMRAGVVALASKVRACTHASVDSAKACVQARTLQPEDDLGQVATEDPDFAANETVEGVESDGASYTDPPAALLSSGEFAAADTPMPEPESAATAWWPGLLWILGATVLIGRVLVTRWLLWRYCRRQRPVEDPRLRQRIDELAARLGIAHSVRVLESRSLMAPVALGSLRPTVVLPHGFAAEYDHPRQEAILAHELAHLAARDPAWQVLGDLACAGLWWHPLVWWARRRLLAACERAADEASLLVPDGPGLLADCLVRLGRRLLGRQRLGWLSMGGGFRSGLGRRVERLVNMQTSSPGTPDRGRLTTAKLVMPVVLVLVAILSTAWVGTQAALGEGETTMGVVQNSWRHSLAAMTLVALLGPTAERTVAEERKDDDGKKPALAAERGPCPDEPCARRDGPSPEQEKLIKRVEEIRRELRELKQAGKKEEAEKLVREQRELMEKLGPPPGRPGPEGRRPGPGPADEARMRHLKEAIRNLHEAGLHELAERVEHMTMERPRRPPGPPDEGFEGRHPPMAGGPGEGRRPPEGGPEGRHPPMARGPGEGRPPRDFDREPPHRGDRPMPPMDPSVQSLRSEVQQLHREMSEMREMLKKLAERQK